MHHTGNMRRSLSRSRSVEALRCLALALALSPAALSSQNLPALAPFQGGAGPLPSLPASAQVSAEGTGQAKAIDPAAAPLPMPTPTPLVFGLQDKARFYLHGVLSFQTLMGPAAEAAFVLAFPPKAYPPPWREGMGAFGRNYGSVLGRTQTADFARFVSGVVLREDPRYYSSSNRALGARVGHAMLFTLIDRGDSGHFRLAVANLAGAAAGGFVGDAYLPSHYTDLWHAGIRTGIQLGNFGIQNLAGEFSPEMSRLAQVLTSPLHHHD